MTIITDTADRDALLRYIDLCNELGDTANRFADLGVLVVSKTLEAKAAEVAALAWLPQRYVAPAPPARPAPAPPEVAITEAQIKHMVDRFLGWRLPADFQPDNGISYIRPAYPPSVDAPPYGTNLFSATQADAMVRHMLAGMPE